MKQTVCKVLNIFQHGKYLVAYVLNMNFALTHFNLKVVTLFRGCTGWYGMVWSYGSCMRKGTLNTRVRSSPLIYLKICNFMYLSSKCHNVTAFELARLGHFRSPL